MESTAGLWLACGWAVQLGGDTLLTEIAAYDARNSGRSAEVPGVGDKAEDAARWTRVWRCIQGARCRQLHRESVGGALLLKWVHSARAVAVIAAEVAEIEARMRAEEEEAAAAAEAARAAEEEAAAAAEAEAEPAEAEAEA